MTVCAAAYCLRGSVLAALPYMHVIAFVTFVPISSLGFRALAPCDCFEYVDGSPRTCFLRTNYEVECRSAEIMSAPFEVVMPALVAIFIYGAGVPAVFGALLWACRDAISGRSMPTELSRSLAFLHGGLKSHVRWWELFVTLRKLTLTGVLALIKPGSLSQLYLGMRRGLEPSRASSLHTWRSRDYTG